MTAGHCEPAKPPATIHIPPLRSSPMSALATSTAVVPTCPTEIAVELAGVSFGYDRARAVLTGIDMTIPRGKVVAIMGGSGCGKTTILRLIGGQLRAQAGTVTVAGQNVR